MFISVSLLLNKLLLFTISIFLSQAETIKPSGKLDFGETKNLDKTGSPSEIITKVTCGPTGCNATNSNHSGIETQILVHVQTKVNLDHHQQEPKVSENEPDVPIVAGLKGEDSNVQNRENSLPSTIDQPSHNDEEYYRPPYRYSGPSTIDYSNVILPITPPSYNRRTFEYDFLRPKGADHQMPYFEQSYNRNYFREDSPPHTIWLGNVNPRNPVEFREPWRPTQYNERNNKYNFNDYNNNYNHFVCYQNGNRVPECTCREQRTRRASSLNYVGSSSSHYQRVIPYRVQKRST